MNVGLYIYEDAEVLDFSGPFEVFATANRLRTAGEAFQVFLIAEEKRAVMARGGYSVNPHFSIHKHPAIDLLIVVGGVHHGELSKAAVLAWIKNTAARATYVASVCTGAFILAQAGLLSGLRVTTHWQDAADLQRQYPSLVVDPSQTYLHQGKFITSGGISAGIDMSLYLVSMLAGQALAEQTAKQMEYHWRQCIPT